MRKSRLPRHMAQAGDCAGRGGAWPYAIICEMPPTALGNRETLSVTQAIDAQEDARAFATHGGHPRSEAWIVPRGGDQPDEVKAWGGKLRSA